MKYKDSIMSHAVLLKIAYLVVAGHCVKIYKDCMARKSCINNIYNKGMCSNPSDSFPLGRWVLTLEALSLINITAFVNLRFVCLHSF